MPIELPKTFSQLLVLLFVALVLACPGMAALCLFNAEMYRLVDIQKLWPLAIAIAVPFFVLNCLTVGLWWLNTPGDRSREKAAQAGLIAGAVFSLLPLYVPLVTRLVRPSFGERSAIWLALALEGAVLLIPGVRLVMVWWKKDGLEIYW